MKKLIRMVLLSTTLTLLSCSPKKLSYQGLENSELKEIKSSQSQGQNLRFAHGEDIYDITFLGSEKTTFLKQKNYLDLSAFSMGRERRAPYPDAVSQQIPCDHHLRVEPFVFESSAVILHGLYTYVNTREVLSACEFSEALRRAFTGVLMCKNNGNVFLIKSFFSLNKMRKDKELQGFSCAVPAT